MLTVAVTVIVPLPLFAAALKYFTAVGTGLPAGIVNGYLTVLSGLATVQVPTQATVGAVLMVEAVVDSVCELAVKMVDAIVRFQPAPLPVVSLTVTASV